jgi:hypothetical protein
MDKLVKRVTVVQSSGDDRAAKVVYTSDDDDSDDGSGQPNFENLERSVRHMLKAQMIAAQEAYQRHLDSAAKKEKNAWLYDAPGNFMKARRKAMKEMRKAAPFRKQKVDDEEED